VRREAVTGLSPLADFGFDDHHLEFEPVPAPAR
jgi:hypothetical protein